MKKSIFADFRSQPYQIMSLGACLLLFLFVSCSKENTTTVMDDVRPDYALTVPSDGPQADGSVKGDNGPCNCEWILIDLTTNSGASTPSDNSWIMFFRGINLPIPSGNNFVGHQWYPDGAICNAEPGFNMVSTYIPPNYLQIPATFPAFGTIDTEFASWWELCIGQSNNLTPKISTKLRLRCSQLNQDCGPGQSFYSPIYDFSNPFGFITKKIDLAGECGCSPQTWY